MNNRQLYNTNITARIRICFNKVSIFRSLILGIIILSILSPYKASAVELSDVDKKLLVKLAESLNSITTMEASFSQTIEDGSSSHGIMLIKRPDRFRIAYSNGSLIIGNGSILKFIDKELQEVQQVFISGTPAEFLVRPSLSFFKDVNVININTEDNKIKVTIKQSKSPNSGEATLFFNSQTYILEGWKIVDALENIIVFDLYDHVFGKEMSNKLFVFYPPPSWKS